MNIGDSGVGLGEIVKAIPPASIHQVTSSNGEVYRGLIYHKSDYYGTHIHYFLNGTKVCPKGETYDYDNITECVIVVGPPDEEGYVDQGNHGGEDNGYGYGYQNQDD